MTAPFSPWPDGDPAERHHRGFVREVYGLLLALAGAVTLLWVLATVDWRWPVGVLAAAAVAGGLWLGRDPAPTVEGD